MKKTYISVAIVSAMAALTLIGFQNFTRYVPRDSSRDARELYMGDALASALKEADRAAGAKKSSLENANLVEEKARAIEAAKAGKKTSSAEEDSVGAEISQ